MDKSLQERLVGAAVLVALGVWLIPWILDGSAVGEPEDAEPDALVLPVPEGAERVAIRRETIDLLDGRSTAQLKSSSAVEGDDAASPPAKQAPASADEAEDVLPQKPVAAVAPPPTPAAEKSEPEPEPEPDASREILAGSPVAGWMVQLGSFSDAGNARRQADRIGTYGHDAQIYEFASAGGRTMFRVRLGPVETRERAEAAASALAAQGFVAQLVAPE